MLIYGAQEPAPYKFESKCHAIRIKKDFVYAEARAWVSRTNDRLLMFLK
jgi:hypothetical protein